MEVLENMVDAQRSKIEQQLVKHLLKSEVWNRAATIGITISRGTEWNTGAIIEKGWQAGKQVCVPKCFPAEKQLQFYKINDDSQLETGFYDLTEPDPEQTEKVNKSEIDLLIVPGFIFDPNGYRIGFGGGYYDRFLSDFPNQTISLAASQQVKTTIPVNEHDIPVQQMITENGIWTV